MSLNPALRFHRYRLINFAARLRKDKGEAVYLTGLSLLASLLAYGAVLGIIERLAPAIQNHLDAVRLYLPIAIAFYAVSFSTFRGPARWMVKWIAEPWAALPLSPGVIYRWALAASFARDSLWILAGIVLTSDIAIVLHLSWIREFGGAILATILFVAASSVSSMFATVALRSARFSSALLRDWLAGFAAASLVQVFVLPYWILSLASGFPGFLLVEILLLIAGVLALMTLEGMTRALIQRGWPSIAASFETTERSPQPIPPLRWVAGLARKLKSQVARVFMLCTLKEYSLTGIPRAYTLVGGLIVSVVSLILIAVGTLILHWPAPVIGISGGILAFMFASKSYGNLAALYTLFRPLPLRFGRISAAAARVPLAGVGIILTVTALLSLLLGLQGAAIAVASSLGVVLALVPLYHFVVLSYPDSRQRADKMSMLAVGIVIVVAIEAPPVMPLVSAVFILAFYRKAKAFWESGEVLIVGPQGMVPRGR